MKEVLFRLGMAGLCCLAAFGYYSFKEVFALWVVSAGVWLCSGVDEIIRLRREQVENERKADG